MTITAKIIADSISPRGKRITTFELEYPRMIHSEFMTHRLFSRNAASSRAIPVKTTLKLIKENTAMPIHWGKNRPGMTAKEECTEYVKHRHQVLTREQAWCQLRDDALTMAEAFDNAGYHKQIVNRLLEVFSHIKVVLTSTEYQNWFWLRHHPDAQPEINALAGEMLPLWEASIPKQLEIGDWHLPYFENGYWLESFKTTYPENHVSLEDAIAISASCAAQVSYRKLDDSLEKAKDIYQKLVYSLPPHFSPMEHQATPIGENDDFTRPGITHLDKSGKYWSGNFCGWIQNRQLMMENLGLEPMVSTPLQTQEN